VAALACPLASCANISTRFGQIAALGGAAHTGVDFPTPTMTPVRAPAAGVVRDVWWNAGGGRMLAITHTDSLETRNAHLASATVRKGQLVRAGEVVAYSGASGALVRGAHLHFEVWVNGAAVDPLPYLTGAGVAHVPDDRPAAVPRDAGTACPAGYQPGLVNPRAWGWFPGSPWWNRPVNAAGLADACVRAGVEVGDNAALVDVDPIGEVVAGLIPVAANVALLSAAVLIGWGGIRRVLDG